MTSLEATSKAQSIATIAKNFELIQLLAGDDFRCRATASELACRLDERRASVRGRLNDLVECGVVLAPVFLGGNFTLLPEKFHQLSQFLAVMGYPFILEDAGPFGGEPIVPSPKSLSHYELGSEIS